MAQFGLQTHYINQVLDNYFRGKPIEFTNIEVYAGLGLEQTGAQINTPDFSEVFGGRPIGAYSRKRMVFGKAVDGVMLNSGDTIFDTAAEDWTTPTAKISMIGIFDTPDYQDPETHELVKPLVVLQLPETATCLKGETIILAKETVTLRLTDI